MPLAVPCQHWWWYWGWVYELSHHRDGVLVPEGWCLVEKAVAPLLGATGKGVCPAEAGQGGMWGPARGRNEWEATFLREPLPIQPSCLPSPFHLWVLSLVFFSSCCVLFLLFPSFQGLGGGGWSEPLGLSLYLDPATSPVFWCMSLWPLPSTCSGCALLVEVGGRRVWPMSPQACPACSTTQSLSQAEGLGGKAP